MLCVPTSRPAFHRASDAADSVLRHVLGRQVPFNQHHCARTPNKLLTAMEAVTALAWTGSLAGLNFAWFLLRGPSLEAAAQ